VIKMRRITAAIASAAVIISVTLWAAAAPRLTSTHTGWRKTACLECHDASTLRAAHKAVRAPGATKSGLAPAKPTECGPCHGYNGAPHEAHAVPINPCGNCHARTAHASAFESPGDCIACHVHPKSPQGRDQAPGARR
jgi:hypothetical protein